MTQPVYGISEIFASIQGEGLNAGRAAVFVRFAGCNRKCQWCDTSHEKRLDYTSVQIASHIERIREKDVVGRGALLVLTGGEPLLQVDDHLVERLLDRVGPSKAFSKLCLETNGDVVARVGAPFLQVQRDSWFITVSPKDPSNRSHTRWGVLPHEVKIVYPGDGWDSDSLLEVTTYCRDELKCHNLFLQPEYGDRFSYSIDKCLEYVRRDPRWRLSVQTQKFLRVP